MATNSKTVLQYVSLRNAVLGLMAAYMLHDSFLYLRKLVLLRFLFGGTTKSSKHRYLSGAELLADLIHGHHIKTVFVRSKAVRLAFIVQELKKKGLKVFEVLKDEDAVFAADAMFRLTGVPAVALIDYPVGVLEIATATQCALRSESAVIIISVGPSFVRDGADAEGYVPSPALLKAHTKATYTAETMRRLASVVEDAVFKAIDCVPGPCYIEIPWELSVPEREARQHHSAQIIQGKIASFIYQYRLDSVFATNTANVRPAVPLQVIPTKAQPGSITRAGNFLKQSQRPLIIVGSQVMLEHGELTSLREMLVQLAVPVCLVDRAQGLLPPTSPFLVQYPEQLFSIGVLSDCVLVVGLAHDYRIRFGEWIDKEAVIISINRTKEQITLNKSPSLAVVCEPAAFAIQLAKSLPMNVLFRSDWLQTVQKASIPRLMHNAPLQENATPLHSLLRAISSAAPADALIIVDDSWIGSDGRAVLGYPAEPFLRLEDGPIRAPHRDVGFALAAKVVNNERAVWVIRSPSTTEKRAIESDLKMLQTAQLGVVFILVDHGPTENDSETQTIKHLRLSALKYTEIVAELKASQHRVRDGQSSVLHVQLT